MLNRIDPTMLDSALAERRLLGTIDLTGSDGGPRCARVDPPAIQWSIAQGPDGGIDLTADSRIEE